MQESPDLCVSASIVCFLGHYLNIKDMIDEQSVTLVFDQLCLALADMAFALDCAQVTVTKLFVFGFRKFNSSCMSEWWNTNVGLPSKLL